MAEIEAMPQAHYRRLERMYASAPINAFFRPRLLVSEGTAELRMTVRRDFFHAAQAVHGSVYFKAMDDAAFFAVNSLVEDVFVLTASFNLYLTRPLLEGEMLAVARVVHRARTQFLAEAELFDHAGKLAARGSGSFMRSEIALTANVGYR
jgi:uncharacterized protein (TIGR00369 family)